MKRRALILIVTVALGLIFVSNGWAPHIKEGGKIATPVSEH
jgi:hypothetical protein